MENMQTGSSLKIPKQSNNVGMWVLAGLLVVAVGVIAWLVWQWMSLDSQNKNLRADNLVLQAEINELKKKVVSGEASPGSTDETACSPEVTAEAKENIAAAVETGNTAALEGYMADTVRVIIAASEGVGDRTPTEAISDMDYLTGGADPWDFALDAATIASWDAGFYTDYFDDNTYAGRAANGMVVVFDFNDCGKINEVFMVANDELLL